MVLYFQHLSPYMEDRGTRHRLVFIYSKSYGFMAAREIAAMECEESQKLFSKTWYIIPVLLLPRSDCHVLKFTAECLKARGTL